MTRVAPKERRSDSEEIKRLSVVVQGVVQGVGFRPFVARLARELGLFGWVRNTSAGLHIEIEGCTKSLERFLLRVSDDRPPHAAIHSLEFCYLDSVGYREFHIRTSSEDGRATAHIASDIATCTACLEEVFDPGNRRYLYPFTNCTHCGPRFSIVERIPYDRCNTTMRHFTMCEDCREEYENPSDRRFHAEPNACPNCGPHMEWWDDTGCFRIKGHDAIRSAAASLASGDIVALKGLGGVHLLVDARSDRAVNRLRQRKCRDKKPLAVMMPSMEVVSAHCEVSQLERRLLASPESPIVLLRARSTTMVSEQVAPGNPYLGVMLPYTPIHHILMSILGFPIVATSGNVSGETMCTDEREAVQRLHNIADSYLVHNRLIARHVDDSICRILLGREQVLRRARGYVPLPIQVDIGLEPTLAVGGQLKNSVALGRGKHVYLSQHVGDLDDLQTYAAFRRVLLDMQSFHQVQPTTIGCDVHPSYQSTVYAHQCGIPVLSVQHHVAHMVGCMSENALEGPALGVVWDGSGFGTDATVWGGEFFRATLASHQRVAHLRTFGLPGSEWAVREPRRSALGMLYEYCGDALLAMEDVSTIRAFSERDLKVMLQLLAKKVNTPLTSSVGRMFDAVASLLDLHQQSSFEGQAAMSVEFLSHGEQINDTYPFVLQAAVDDVSDSDVVDWGPMLELLLEDLRAQESVARVATRFQNTLVEMIVAVALKVGLTQVTLSGGCFLNKYLTERAVRRLKQEGFQPYWHRRVPPHDGGLSLGQVVVASHHKSEQTLCV